MADSKKYNGSTWEHSLRKLTTSTDTLTTLPAVIHPTGTTATVGLKGNTLQSSIPSPTSPIMPQGTGDLETSGAKAGQYKIPISSAGQTTPIYLDEVETTRKVKKLVLTGQETFNRTISSTESGTSVYSVRYDTIGMEDIIDYDSPMLYISYPIFICSHFKMKTNTSFGTPYTAIKNGEIGANSVENSTYNRYAIFASNQYTSVDTFKEYLAAQYANGTPVTIWYILAEPTTGIVNEPLMKIGDYADTVSGITIPTITGKDTVDVDTTLKPSEVSLSYTGWHDAEVKKWDGSQWQ